MEGKSNNLQYAQSSTDERFLAERLQAIAFTGEYSIINTLLGTNILYEKNNKKHSEDTSSI